MIHRMASSGLYSWPYTEESQQNGESEERSSLNGKLDRTDSWSDVSDCGALGLASDTNIVIDGSHSLPDRLVRSVEMGYPINYNESELTPENDFVFSHANPNYFSRKYDIEESQNHTTNGLGHSSKNKTKTKKINISQRQKETLVSTSPDQGEKIKTKFLAAWNNMKYSLSSKMKTNFKYDSPICMLGKYYHRSLTDHEDEVGQSSSAKPHITSMEEFKRDFTSRFWFTYRREFAPLPGDATIISDCGWGCMLRTGQMMLAQAFVMHLLGREWRWQRRQTQQEIIYHREIVKFFGDYLSEQCPFSIHHLVQIGAETGKKAGDWYGPASVAHILREAMVRVHEDIPLLRNLSIYVAQDCTVYKEDLMDLCTHRPRSASRNSRCSESSQDGSTEDAWGPVVILVPVRLGGEVLNPIYIPCVRALLTLDQCLGIMGGKPKHSVFFNGWQDEKLIYLDPHFVQEVVDVKQRDFPLHSFHCMSPRKMQFSKMDPSCTIAFYCRNLKDYENLVTHAKSIVAPPMQKGEYPMFIFAEGKSCDMGNFHEAAGANRTSQPNQNVTNTNASRTRPLSNDLDDFVLLG